MDPPYEIPMVDDFTIFHPSISHLSMLLVNLLDTALHLEGGREEKQRSPSDEKGGS